MKFTPTKFTALFSDGIHELSGYSFDVGRRQLVAHHARAEMRPIDKNWHVSERTSGFPIGIATAPTRFQAARIAANAMPSVTDQEWKLAISGTMAIRAKEADKEDK